MATKHERKMQKFDRYVAEMRAAGCVVIAYSPDDVRNAITYQFADSSADFEWHPEVNLVQVAQDVHEDDGLWDYLSEAVGYTYRNHCDEADREHTAEEVN
jgi:hypothetical protein